MNLSEFAVDLLKLHRLTSVVDVGASELHDAPPYQLLREAGLCKVTGFDPQAELMPKPSVNEFYLPYVIGDGGEHTLYICAYPGWTSLLKPNAPALDIFTTFREQARVVREQQIKTRKLNDIKEITHCDFLKIDAQGSELNVLYYGGKKLYHTAVVHLEMSFVQLYDDQPELWEIDQELRGQGFIPHSFATLKRWPIDSAFVIRDERFPPHQMLEGDVVYVKDFVHHGNLTSETLKHLALIMHTCYGSYDLAAHCIRLLEKRGEVPDGRLRYSELLRTRQKEEAA